MFSWQQQPYPSAAQTSLPGMHQLGGLVGGWAGRVDCVPSHSCLLITVCVCVNRATPTS
jgi:hypothetical protein